MRDEPLVAIVAVHTAETNFMLGGNPVSYTHLRAHETPEHLVCRLLLEAIWYEKSWILQKYKEF